MKKHTINYEDFIDYKATCILASSAGSSGTKRLIAVTAFPEVSSHLEVTVNGKTEMETDSFAEAVAEYNEW